MLRQKMQGAGGVGGEIVGGAVAASVDAARTKAVDRERRIAPGCDPLAPTVVDLPPVSIAAMQQDDGRRGSRAVRTSQIALQRMRTRQRRFEFDGGAGGLGSRRGTCERMSDQECTGEDSDFGELHHAPPSSPSACPRRLYTQNLPCVGLQHLWPNFLADVELGEIRQP